MEVEFEDHWHPATKLNVIGAATDHTVVDPLPGNVTRDEIEEYCYAVEGMYGRYVEELVAETTLSQREAQAWVLRNLVFEGTDRLTLDAVGLYIWAIGRDTDGDPLSRTIAADYHDRAQRKFDDAEATARRAGPPPYPDDMFDDPAQVWVETHTGERLARRLGEGESYDDALSRLLDATAETAALADLVEAYRDQRDASYVGVETVRPGWDARLPIQVHVPDAGARPAVADVDSLTLDDQYYPFDIDERLDAPGTDSLLTLYADAGETVAPGAGIDLLRTALARTEGTLPGVVDRARETGAVALAVGDQPAAAGAHLLPVFADDPDPTTLEHLERLDLVDRTLTVGRVTPLSVAEYADHARTSTLLWTEESAPLDEPKDLPEDPFDRRDELPADVLRTS